jgi:hypothetical protein
MSGLTGILWTAKSYGFPVFLCLTFLGAAAAMATGRAIATVWEPIWRIVPASLLIAAGVRFLHFALFQEQLLSLQFYLVTFLVLLGVAWLGYTWKRANQMARQYPWAFKKIGLIWSSR